MKKLALSLPFNPLFKEEKRRSWGSALINFAAHDLTVATNALQPAPHARAVTNPAKTISRLPEAPDG